MSHPIDTKRAFTVADATLAVFRRMFPRMEPGLFVRVFADVDAMFAGRYLDYQPIDTPYHDLEHTLQVTFCFAEIMEGRNLAGIEPRLDARQFELGIAAALLHDTGYLKLRSDQTGTGAKYTFTHVLRSCAVASSYLPTLGVSLDELDGVLGSIRCTNPTTVIRRLHFQNAVEGIMGCAVATADYLGQMAAPNYLGDLPNLFAEFEESDNFAGVAMDQRVYRSVEELTAKTPGFWKGAVLPKLDNELLGLYRFLARPYPSGRNRYIDSVNQNITIIEAAVAASAARRGSS